MILGGLALFPSGATVVKELKEQDTPPLPLLYDTERRGFVEGLD
jgi:hypothetical protein